MTTSSWSATLPDHSTNISWDHMLSKFLYTCPAESGFIRFGNTVDPDQLAS